jgi:mRNA interferase RelE/StbE
LKEADRALQKMQLNRRLAILEKIKAYAQGEPVDIWRLKGSHLSRIRVGQDRVIVDDLGTVVMVLKAGPRGSIYKD